MEQNYQNQENTLTSEAIINGKSLAVKAIDFIEKRSRVGEPTGINTGLIYLDRLIKGFNSSDLIILCSRHDSGKTALALSMIQNIAINNKIPCGLISLEESCETLSVQLLSQMAEVKLKRLNCGILRLDEFRMIGNSADKLSKSPFYMTDTPRLTLAALSELTSRMVKEQNVKILFIDYLQLIETEKLGQSCYDKMTEIAVCLKKLAGELRIPIVVLCTVPSVTTKEKSDLDEIQSIGDIDQAADVILFLHRNKGEEITMPAEAKIVIAKNQHGPVGDVPVYFFKDYFKFADLEESY